MLDWGVNDSYYDTYLIVGVKKDLEFKPRLVIIKLFTAAVIFIVAQSYSSHLPP